MDAAGQRRPCRGQRHRLREGQTRRGVRDPRRGPDICPCRSVRGRRALEGKGPGRPRLRAHLSVFGAQAGPRAVRGPGGLCLDGGGHRCGTHLGPLWRRRPATVPVVRDPLRAHGGPERSLLRLRGKVRRHGRKGRQRPAPARLERARPHVQVGDDPAHVPGVLALRHLADLLRPRQLVHPHDRAQAGAARQQPRHQLGAGPRQERAHGRLARKQRRLGDLALALLGHPASVLGLREMRRAAMRQLGQGARPG